MYTIFFVVIVAANVGILLLLQSEQMYKYVCLYNRRKCTKFVFESQPMYKIGKHFTKAFKNVLINAL